MQQHELKSKELISPHFEREIRRFVRACYLHGHGDDWVDSLMRPTSNPSMRMMIGVSRSQAVELILNEVTKFKETISRERDLAETLSPTKTQRF